MKYIIDKRNYIILFIIMILIFLIIFFPKRKPFVKSYRVDGLITVVIYDNVDKKYVDSTIKKIIDKDYKISFNDFDISNYDLTAALKVKNIISFLKRIGVKKYLINENGNVTSGKGYNGLYSVSMNDFNGDFVDVIYIENMNLSSVKLEGDFYDSVYVIGKDNVIDLIYANYLSNIDFKQAKKVCKKNNIEAYFLRDDETFMTKGFKKFLK